VDLTYNISLETEPNPGAMKAIGQGLLSFNSLHTGGAIPQPLVVTLRDRDKTIVGGLIGTTYLGWLQVHALWLPEELRSHGHGGTLLTAAEEEAIRRGCANACLETFSFQALPFYQKRGYVVFGQLPDFLREGRSISSPNPCVEEADHERPHKVRPFQELPSGLMAGGRSVLRGWRAAAHSAVDASVQGRVGIRSSRGSSGGVAGPALGTGDPADVP
jgi:hypothetical protein